MPIRMSRGAPRLRGEMAGRFVLKKFASGMSRSTSLLSAHASASARATTPVIPGASEAGIRTFSDVFHGAATNTPAAIPYASEAGIRTLSNVFLRAAARPSTVVPGSHVLHGCGARYLNTFSCSREAAKTGWSKTGMPDSVGGVKPTGSSGASKKLQLTDWAARVKAWWAPVQSNLYELDTSFKNMMMLFVLGVVCFVPLPSEYKNRSKVPVLHCSGCCNCISSRSKS